MKKYWLIHVKIAILKKEAADDLAVEPGKLGHLFKNIGKICARTRKELDKNEMEKPRRAFELAAEIWTAAVCRNTRAVLSISTIPV